jgi:hypothetical protein
MDRRGIAGLIAHEPRQIFLARTVVMMADSVMTALAARDREHGQQHA